MKKIYHISQLYILHNFCGVEMQFYRVSCPQGGQGSTAIPICVIIFHS